MAKKIYALFKMFVGSVMWIAGFYAIIFDSLSPSDFSGVQNSFLIPYPITKAVFLWILITAAGLVILISGVKKL